MPRPGEIAKRVKGGGRCLPAAAVLFLVGLLLGLPGCAGQHKREGDADPLVGPGPKGLKANSATPTKTNSPVPALPTANSSASNAAMATGDPLVGGRNLGIDDSKGVGKTGGWQGIGLDGRPIAPTNNEGVRTASGAILRRPEPIVEAVPQVQPGPASVPRPVAAVPVALGGNPAAASLDQLQAQLTARGVAWQRQEVTKEGVRVTCGVPDRANPDSEHIYYATAPDAVAALQAVLAKIDNDQRR